VGKGDKRRPTVVSDEEHQARWDRTFAQKKACLTCGRDHREHRTAEHCCYECHTSRGEVHSIGCDTTWRERA
jgi:hypothetical protein